MKRFAFLLVVLGGCQATPPEIPDAGKVPPGSGHYVTVARCTPASGSAACPGPACGANVIGAPDGRHADLAVCGVLDVVFTGGTIIGSDSGRTPELALHLGAAAQGIVRVEASSDGQDYRMLGFLERAPAGTRPECIAQNQSQRALLSVTRCTLLANVRHLRISAEATARASIDAIEALVFRELGR